MSANDTTVIGNYADMIKMQLPNGKAIQRVTAALAERDDSLKFLPAMAANMGLLRPEPGHADFFRCVLQDIGRNPVRGPYHAKLFGYGRVFALGLLPRAAERRKIRRRKCGLDQIPVLKAHISGHRGKELE